MIANGREYQTLCFKLCSIVIGMYSRSLASTYPELVKEIIAEKIRKIRKTGNPKSLTTNERQWTRISESTLQLCSIVISVH